MAISLGPAKGRRRPLDAALNLVPFIDLLSCCIAFLLITAVWSHNSQLQAHAGGRGEGVRPEEEATRPWRLLVSSAEWRLRAPDASDFVVAPEALTRELRQRGVEALTIVGGDTVPYMHFVRALDAARAADIIVDVALDAS